MARCLIVDDSETMREIAADHLAALGHQTDEATGAQDAITALRQSPGQHDVMFLDWDLPALGALDVLRAAGELAPRPVIVLCATENDTRQFALAKAAGAPHHILKPFDRACLAGVMAEIAAVSDAA